MREGPTQYARAAALGVAAMAALTLAACADMPTAATPGTPDQEGLSITRTVSGEGYVAGRVLVKFDGDAAAGAIVERAAGEVGAPVREMVEADPVLRLNLVRVERGREMDLIRALREQPGVEYAEPDWVRTLTALPNDAFFGYQWGLHNDGTVNNSTGTELATTAAVDADIDWLEAYEHLAGSSFSTVNIAILDTGIRQDHEDLAAKIVGQHDFFDGDGDAADDDGHGSHTAGIAAAIGENGRGIAGVAWHNNAKLLVAKVCGQIFGGPRGYGCPTSATASAIRWASDNGARVINLSLGGATGSAAEQDALQYALANNTLAFCATGNDNSVVSYPAAFPECVAVGATDWGDTRASYSNFGPETEIAAPGGDDEDANGYSYIVSSYFESPTSYVLMAGTSMATPMATGLGGLLASLGVATADEIRSIVTSTADDLGPAGRDASFGFGRINVYQAVLAAGGGGSDPGNTAPSASFTFSCTDLGCAFDGSGSSDADGDALAYSWSFGDGGSGSGATTSHTYAAGGTYTVTLTVSDGAATGSQSQTVTVTAPSSGGIALSATGYKVKGIQHADLSWSGGASTSVDIFRDGAMIATTANDGAHTDNIGQKGGGSHTYRVCEAGTSTCSNDVTVVF